MDKENIGKEKSGSRRAERQSPAEKSGSRYTDRQNPLERNGSRHAERQSPAEKSGSRYADRQNPLEKSGSRHADRQSPTEKSGSRYADRQNPLEQEEYHLKAKRPEASWHHESSFGKKGQPEKQAARERDVSTERSARNEGRHAESSRAKGKHKSSRTEGRHAGAGRIRAGRWDPVRIALICLAAVAVTAYLVVAFYYSRHFYSGSRIYGIDCSRKTAAQVRQEISEKIGEYTLTIQERGGQKDVLTASQIGLYYLDDNGIESQLKKQLVFIWPAMMLMGNTGSLAVNTAYDRDGIDQVLKQMNCFLPGNIIAPQDAYRGDTADGYEVVPEVMGTTLNYEKTKEVILAALDRGADSVSLDEAGCYIDPVIYQDDTELNAEVEELNSLLKARITYDFADRQEVVDASVMKKWILQDSDGAYYIDENQIWAYVAELAEKYDTFGGHRTFYTSIGTAVELSGGDYGWAMDQDATAQILSDAVKEGRQETLTPEYVYTGMDRSENDIGGTYVEICISRQQMWCYQDGYLMVDTPVVTGNPNKDNGTPSGGVWAIDAKMQDYVLRGEGYAAPVDYWMPFNGDVGIHDMQNRAYFGSTIYLTNGSHGCVNTPYEAAQTIYNIVSIGTPVVVYE